MRFSSRSCSSLRVLRLYLKVAIFEPELQEHAPRTTFVLKSCDFQAGAAADQGGIEPGTAGLRKQARTPRDNFQKPFRDQDKFARRHSESASTRTISAEGSPRSRQIRTAPQRERFDTHDPRRGFIGLKKIRTAPQRERFKTHDLRRGFAALKTNSHGAAARALRHARSPQRVHRAQDKFARRDSESASTRTISAEGSSGSRQIRTAPQRERFDTHDLRRGVRFVSSCRAYPRQKKKKN